jgi:disulfide oxidoreductase YuzD
MTNQETAKLIVDMLRPCLKRKRENGRFDTTWGDKTEEGLIASIARLIEGDVPKERE